MSISGFYPGFTPATFPATPGLEGMGTVASAGTGVTTVTVNQRVVAVNKGAKAGKGTWQRFIVVGAEAVIPIPDNVSNESAAQFFVNPVSVIGMIDGELIKKNKKRERMNSFKKFPSDGRSCTGFFMYFSPALSHPAVLKPPKDSYIVQTAAGSALGKQFIQIAKVKGFKTINIVRRKEQIEELTKIGADVVLWSEAEGFDLVTEVKKATGEDGAFGAISPVTGEVVADLTKAVRLGGETLLFGALGGVDVKLNVVTMIFNASVVKGFWLSVWVGSKTPAEFGAACAELMGYLSKGIITPDVGAITFPLEKALEAIKAASEPARSGKVLLIG